MFFFYKKILILKVDEQNISCQIFQVSQKQENSSTKEFQNFLKILESNVEKAENIRVLRHLRFLFINKS